MTNREWLEKQSNEYLASRFCYELAKDGRFCKEHCPFEKLCNGQKAGIEVWLEEEYKGE
jgi:hypothetical protein